MSPVYGSADSGIQALWNDGLRDDADGTARDRGMRMESRLGYGLSAPGGHGLLTPYAEMTSGDSTRRYRLGMNWEAGSLFDLNLVGERSESTESSANAAAQRYRLEVNWDVGSLFDLNLVGERTESAANTGAEHAILLKGVIPF